ncbi:MAG TPA: hypothetical protein VMR54_03140 [Thermoanaerobaculia bacterium]|nr:hypothetical protein [Thermoanaerobaculia bacterium]
MGIDLVSACIFCAPYLLGAELPPRNGLGTEIGFSYATLDRLLPPANSGESADISEVTPKFLLVGVGEARPPPVGLGAGTPAFEWRVRVALAPSHDNQIRTATSTQEPIETDGTGRYENFALLGRFPIGGQGSLEAVLDRRTEKATDLLNIGGQEHQISEQRNLTAERADGALGWRQRWKDLEVAARVQYAKVTGYNATAGAYMNSSGGIFGGGLEGRYRTGGWTTTLDFQWLTGSIDVLEESFPAFQARKSSQNATLQALRFGLGYSWPRTDLFLTATFDRQRLPFVSLAVLGVETVAFDGGYHPDSNNREFYGDLTVRYTFTPSIRARIGMRMATGHEKVTLTDALGDRPPITLDVDRRGRFGGGFSENLGFPEFTLYVGADFAIGGGH